MEKACLGVCLGEGGWGLSRLEGEGMLILGGSWVCLVGSSLGASSPIKCLSFEFVDRPIALNSQGIYVSLVSLNSHIYTIPSTNFTLLAGVGSFPVP